MRSWQRRVNLRVYAGLGFGRNKKYTMTTIVAKPVVKNAAVAPYNDQISPVNELASMVQML